MPDWRSVGQPVAHVEGPDKVTGRARYTADISPARHAVGQVPQKPVSARPHPVD